jgi:hypothetical protein
MYTLVVGCFYSEKKSSLKMAAEIFVSENKCLQQTAGEHKKKAPNGMKLKFFHIFFCRTQLIRVGEVSGVSRILCVNKRTNRPLGMDVSQHNNVWEILIIVY